MDLRPGLEKSRGSAVDTFAAIALPAIATPRFSEIVSNLYKRTKMASKFDVNSKPTFLPVKVVASPAPKTRGGELAVLEARLMSGLVVRFAVGSDTRYLAELLAALG